MRLSTGLELFTAGLASSTWVVPARVADERTCVDRRSAAPPPLRTDTPGGRSAHHGDALPTHRRGLADPAELRPGADTSRRAVSVAVIRRRRSLTKPL